MTLRQRIRFYQQLAVLVRAGLPIRASLMRLKERMPDRGLAILSEKVNAGERLGDAFVAAGFSAFECHLIVAGEKSAQLDTVFQHLSEFWTRELQMRQALIRPLYYPIVVLHLAILMGAVVEFTLPGSTLHGILIHLVVQLATLYVIGFVIYSVVRASWSSEAFQRFWLWIPLIGGSLRSAYAYRWITALKLEFSAGISLYRAVGDAWRASGYVGCEQRAEEGEEAMRQGVELSKLMIQWKELPRDWIDFIETGEVSGALEEAFKNLEAEAAHNWSLAQQRMSEWLPKIVYFIVLLVVAAQVFSVLYQAIVAPMNTVENAIDAATKQ